MERSGTSPLGGLSARTIGQGRFLHFHRSKRLSGLGAETMLHFGEVFSAEIYARDVCSRGYPQRVEGSFETMGFTRRFLWYFLFADEKKVRTFPLRADDILPYNIGGNIAQKGTGDEAPVPFAMGNVYEERKNQWKTYTFSTTNFSSRSKIFAVSPFWRLPSSICSATASSTVD